MSFVDENIFFGIENKIIDLIVENCEDFQDRDIIQRGSFDDAYKITFSRYTDYPRFALVEFEGGILDQNSKTFDGPATWFHNINVDFYIPVRNANGYQQVEDDSRKVYYQFIRGVAANRRCLGGGRLMEVHRTYTPTRVEIRKQPYIKVSTNIRVKEILG